MSGDGKPTKQELDDLRKATLEALSRGDTEMAKNLGDAFNLVTDFGKDLPEE